MYQTLIVFVMAKLFNHRSWLSAGCILASLASMATPVVEMWAQSKVLMNRGSVGKLALVTNPKCIDRADVVANADVLIPVLKFHGTRVTIDLLAEQVELFFAFSRPRGKPPIPSPLVAT